MTDLDKKNDSEEVIEGIHQKLVEMSEDGFLEVSGRPKNGQAESVEREAAG